VAVKTGSAVVTSEVIAYGVWPSIYPEPQKFLLAIYPIVDMHEQLPSQSFDNSLFKSNSL